MERDPELSAAIDAAQVAGAVAMTGGRDGIHYSRAFGSRGLDGAAMQTDDLFQIASMTKAPRPGMPKKLSNTRLPRNT